jgi:hypothetical protein
MWCLSGIKSNPLLKPLVRSPAGLTILKIRGPESGRRSKTSLKKNQGYSATLVPRHLHADNKHRSSQMPHVVAQVSGKTATGCTSGKDTESLRRSATVTDNRLNWDPGPPASALRLVLPDFCRFSAHVPKVTQVVLPVLKAKSRPVRPAPRSETKVDSAVFLNSHRHLRGSAKDQRPSRLAKAGRC